MAAKIALFGGSFNPPAKHHRAILERLSPHFDRVVVLPCGPRPDKATVGDVEPLHRAVMADLAFRGLPKVEVELFDLENSSFTRTRVLEERYGREGEVWHIVGGDLVAGGGRGESLIHRDWEQGKEMWRKLNFAVFERPGYELAEGDLPPRSLFFRSNGIGGSSTEIRECAFRRQDIGNLVDPAVHDHIRRHNLYCGLRPAAADLRLGDIRPLVLHDETNPRAVELAGRWSGLAGDPDPNCVVAIGGDGTMIRAIRDNWRRRLPFIGINAGHRGYLLNDPDVFGSPSAVAAGAKSHLLPLLHVEIETPDDKHFSRYAVNDAWVERDGGQAAWFEVKINGETRLPKLVCDGVLAATAAGSTAYARAMGARPIPIGTPGFLLVGSNVMEPDGWKSAVLPLDAEIEVISLDPVKRPVRAFIAGEDAGPAVRFRVRMSRVAAAEIAFAPDRDMSAKLVESVFPGWT